MTLSFLEAEVGRLAAKASAYGLDTQWKQNEFSEILPFPKPLSLSVLRGLAGHNGATGIACRELGLSYSASVPVDDYLETVFGRTYVNTAAEKLLIRKDARGSFVRAIVSSAKLLKAKKLFYRTFDDIAAELDRYFESSSRQDMKALSQSNLLRMTQDLLSGLNGHYRYVVKAGILANHSLDEIAAKTGIDEAARLTGVDSLSIFSRDKDALKMLHYRESELHRFDQYSAEIDYELACPRLIEEDKQSSHGYPRQKQPVASEKRKIPKGLNEHLFFFKAYEMMKAVVKAMLLRELYLMRLALLEIGDRYGLGDDIFYLDPGEVFNADSSHARKTIAERKLLEQAFLPIHIPALVSPSDLPGLIHGGLRKAAHELKGICVNGFGFEGKALLYDSEKDLEMIGADTIVVSRYASPNLVMVFSRARGVIAETGGMLSHLAIVAREQRFPLVLQASDATDLIKNGDRLVIDEKGRISFA